MNKKKKYAIVLLIILITVLPIMLSQKIQAWAIKKLYSIECALMDNCRLDKPQPKLKATPWIVD